jgi:hypothetical protein
VITGYRTAGALVALVLGSGALHFAQQRVEMQADAHSPRMQAAGMPSLGLQPADSGRLTKLDLVLPPEEHSPAEHITLEKFGPVWRITTPVAATADLEKVGALLEDLVGLRLGERIDANANNYQRYDLTDSTAFHLTAWVGSNRATDLYFGKSSARGQLLRIAGTDGVFTVHSSGSESFAGFLYTRPLRGWRERAILAFKPSDAVAVRIENRHGLFSFARRAGHWCGSLTLRRPNGALGIEQRSWARFDPSRIEALLAGFKSLSADELGRDEDRAGSGLDQAEVSGGVIQITLDEPPRELVIRVGNIAHGPSDWAIQNSRWATKVDGDGTLYALATWTTDWVTSGASQFEQR